MIVRTTTRILAVFATMSMASTAFAQDWESGDTGGGDWGAPPAQQPQPQQQPPAQPAPAPQPQPQPQPQQQQWQQQQPQQQGWSEQQQQQEQPPGWGEDEGEGDDGRTDHEKVVGSFGVGFFGVTQLPTAVLFDGGMDLQAAVGAPTVGIRYWLSEGIGLDVALGLGFVSESRDTDVNLRDFSAVGAAVHAGLPIVFADYDHYKFLLVPDLTVGITDGSIGGDPDTLFSGFLFELGARIGGEVQFGFIDIPSLALQATVGARLRYESTSLDTDPDAPIQDDSRFSFATTVEDEPWDIFVGSITAIYYLR